MPIVDTKILMEHRAAEILCHLQAALLGFSLDNHKSVHWAGKERKDPIVGGETLRETGNPWRWVEGCS